MPNDDPEGERLNAALMTSGSNTFSEVWSAMDTWVVGGHGKRRTPTDLRKLYASWVESPTT